jgi:hypothetical protein
MMRADSGKVVTALERVTVHEITQASKLPIAH